MTSKSSIEELLKSAYDARVRGDLEGTLAYFADDAVMEVNARGIGVPELASPLNGKAAIRPVLQQLMRDFRFTDWRTVALLVDGERALLHWKGTVTFVPNGKAATFDVFDLITLRDGKIVSLHQSTDTAMMAALST